MLYCTGTHRPVACELHVPVHVNYMQLHVGLINFTNLSDYCLVHDPSLAYVASWMQV